MCTGLLLIILMSRKSDKLKKNINEMQRPDGRYKLT